MNKAQIIRWLEDKKQKADTQYADGMNDGLSFAIALIEQMEEEPITAEALEKAGWSANLDRPTREFFKIPLDSAEFARSLIVLRNDEKWSALANDGGERVWFSLRHMQHLRTLEEMFLS